LGCLRSLTNLERLGLACTQATDVSLENVKELPSLQYLRLNGTQVTDVG
jgi:Leucine-rich repeat (LRR) protein